MTEARNPVLGLLQFEGRIRSAASNREIAFRAVNETNDIFPFDQAVLWRLDVFERPMVVAASGLADVTVDSPYQQWVGRLIRSSVPDPFDKAHAVALEELPQELAEEGTEWSRAQMLLCPLLAPQGRALGGIAFFRGEPFSQAELDLANWIGKSVGFGLWAWRRDRPRLRRWLKSRALATTLAAIAMIAGLLALVPVPLTALAPAEITPLKPFPITSPTDGVVREIVVAPNEIVKADQVVAMLDDTGVRNRLAVAEKALEIARADLRRIVYKSFSDEASRLELQVLNSRVSEKAAEAAFLSELLGKLNLRTPQGGVAVFASQDEWRGRPVQTGERVMVIADPSLIDVTAYISPEDAIELDPGARVVVFLHIDPLSSLEAKITRSSYEAVLSPDGTLSYVVRAELATGHSFPRIGLRGTAKIYAGRVSLGYYLLRKPLAFMRRWVGI